jgi:hypothetical protein
MSQNNDNKTSITETNVPNLTLDFDESEGEHCLTEVKELDEFSFDNHTFRTNGFPTVTVVEVTV